MKLPVMLVVLCFLASGSVTAVDGSGRENSLVDGARALQFEVVGDLFNLDFTSFQGSTISYKWHTSDRSAIRAGITFDLELRDYTEERRVNDSLINDRNNEADDYRISVELQKIWYHGQPKRLAMFYGLGPLLSYLRNDVSMVDGLRDQSSERTNRRYGGGLSFVLGAEWFAAHNISLLLEYRTDAQYFHTTTEITDSSAGATSIREVTDNEFDISARAVRLGLTLYF